MGALRLIMQAEGRGDHVRFRPGNVR
jgi:hypothetical protein